MRRANPIPWSAGLVMLLGGNAAMAEWTLNMTEGVTEISRQVYNLHMIFFIVCVVIGVLVFGAMIVSMVLHRTVSYTHLTLPTICSV